MKENLINKIRCFSLFIVIFSLSFTLNFVNSQEDEEDNSNYFVHFDLSDPDIVIVDKDNSNPELKDIIANSHSIVLPNVELDKEGYFFSGWTEDWVYGFLPGDVFLCKSKNVTLKPVFGLLSDKRTFRLEYLVEFEGNIVDTSAYLPKGNYCKNRIVKTSLMSFPQSNAVQRGWTDGENSFYQEQKLVMPEHNVTLKAIFYYYRTLTYDSGNVEGKVGVTQNIQKGFYGAQMDLAESSRLARKGYENVAWHCENDGKDYPFFYAYIMPDEDVVMTAVWKPITYVIVFRTGINSVPDFRIRGETDGIIIAPSLENEREGYTFNGWKMYGSEIFYPGDEIIVRGQMPGFGISANAIWNKN
jgi:hypothetical protein